MIVIMGGGIIRREKETHKIGEVHGQPMGFGGRDLNKISPGRGQTNCFTVVVVDQFSTY